MTKRGRPSKGDTAGFHKVQYHQLSKKRENKVLKDISEERLLAGYEKIYQLAYDSKLSWSYKERLKEDFKEWGLLI